MAYPSRVAGTSYEDTGTTHTTFNMLSSVTVAVGETLVAIVACNDLRTLSTSSTGWTKAAEDSNSDISLAIFKKEADDTSEDLTVTASSNTEFLGQLLRYTGGGEVSANFATGSTTTPDPPNINASGDDQIAIAVHASRWSSSKTQTGTPSGYGNALTIEDANDKMILSSLDKQINGNEDPGTFTISSAGFDWGAATILIANPNPASLLYPNVIII